LERLATERLATERLATERLERLAPERLASERLASERLESLAPERLECFFHIFATAFIADLGLFPLVMTALMFFLTNLLYEESIFILERFFFLNSFHSKTKRYL